MKIAIGGIATENSTFSIWHTSLADFTLTRGEMILARYPFLSHYSEIEFVPLVRARALPGGPVEQAAYNTVKSELLTKLRESGPWDGVYLDMHGAMNVFGMEDAEGDWMQSIREVVGPDSLISASYDLHGNVSERVIRNVDILTAYRTAPHVDVMETLERALELLVSGLRDKIRPYKQYISVPIALPGEKTSTEWEPGEGLYNLLPETLSQPGILDASLTVGYAWADEPRSHAAVIVLGTDEKVVDSEALKLAAAYWDVRKDFQFGVPVGTSDECIQMALDSPESCVFISDSGDNPTAGGVGDVTYTLGRMIDLGVPDAVYASIPDAESVEKCFAAGEGNEVQLQLGGKLDTVHSKPLLITGIVLKTAEFPRIEYGQDTGTNKQAVVRVGNVKVIVTEYRTPFHYISHFQRLDIEPLEHKLVVIKIGYLEPDLKRAAPKALLALSPGAVNQALEQLSYHRIQRPIYPLDPEMEWEPQLNQF